MPKISMLIAVMSVALITGCGGSAGPTPGGKLTTQQHAARLALVKSNSGLNDLELTHLCPALYPAELQQAAAADSGANTVDGKKAKKTLQKYRFDSQKIRVKAFTKQQLDQAKLARCGAPIPLPAPSAPAKK
jgi:hypothetical protein